MSISVEEFQRLQEQLLTLRTADYEKQTAMHKLQKDLEHEKAAIEELKKTNAGLEKELKKANVVSIFKQKSKKAASDLSDENEKLQQDLQMLREQEKQNEQQLEGLKKTVRQLMETTEKAEREGKEHRLKATELERQVLRLKMELSEREDKLKGPLVGAPLQNEFDVQKFEKLKREKDQEIGILHTKLEEISQESAQRVSDLEGKIQELQAKLDQTTQALESQGKALNQLKLENEGHLYEISKKEGTIQQLTSEKQSFDDEKKGLKAEIERVNQELERSQNSVLEKEGVDNHVTEVISSLRVQMEAQTKLVTERNEQIESLKGQIQDLKGQLGDKNEEIRLTKMNFEYEQEAHSKALQKEKEEFEKKSSSIEAHLATQQAENAKLHKLLSQTEEEKKKAIEQVEEATRQCQEIQADALAKGAMIGKLQQELKMLDEEKKDLASEVSRIKEKDDLSQQQILELKSALETHQIKAGETHEVKKKHEELEKEVVKLWSQISQLETENDSLRSKRDQLVVVQQQKDAMAQELEKLQAEKQVSEKENAKLRESLDTAVKELKNVDKQHQEQTAQLLKAGKEREKLLRDEVDRQTDQLKKEAEMFGAKLRESAEERIRLQNRIETLEKDLKNKDNMNEMAVRAAEEKANSRNSEINELVKTVQIKETAIYDLQKRLDDSEAKLKETLEHLEHATHESEEKILGLDEKIKALDQKLQQRNATIKEQKEAIDKLTTDLKDLTVTNTEVSKEYEELQQNHAALIEERDALKTKIEGLEKGQKGNVEEIRQLKDILQQKIQQLDMIEQEKAEKDNTIKILDRTKSAMIKDLQKQLEKEKKLVDGVGFRLPDLGLNISRQSSTMSVRSMSLTPTAEQVDQRTLQDENNSLINKVAVLQSEKWRLEEELRRAREQLNLAQVQHQSPTQSQATNIKALNKVQKTNDPKVLNEIVSKMQIVLEDVMAKNVILQKEIDRLKGKDLF